MSDQRRPSLIERATAAIGHIAEIGAKGLADSHDRQTTLSTVISRDDSASASGDTNTGTTFATESLSSDANYRIGLAAGEKLDPAGERWESSTVPSSILEGRASAVQHHHGILDRNADVPAMAERIKADNTPHYNIDSPPDNAPMGGWAAPTGHPTTTAPSAGARNTVSEASSAINAAMHTSGAEVHPAYQTGTNVDVYAKNLSTLPDTSAEALRDSHMVAHVAPDNKTLSGPLSQFGLVSDHMAPDARDKIGAWAYHQGESQHAHHSVEYGSAMPVSPDYGSMSGYDRPNQPAATSGAGIIESMKSGASSLVSGIANLTHSAEDKVEHGVDRARDATSSAAGQVRDATSSAAGQVRDATSAAAGQVAGGAEKMYDYAKDQMSAAGDALSSAAHKVESRAESLLDTATDKVYDAYGSVREKSAEALGEAKHESHDLADKARSVMASAANAVTHGMQDDHDKQMGTGDYTVIGTSVTEIKKIDRNEDNVSNMLT